MLFPPVGILVGHRVDYMLDPHEITLASPRGNYMLDPHEGIRVSFKEITCWILT